MKKQKGITLLALVISIIVILILAAVTTSMLTGDNGTITNATRAKFMEEMSSLEEQIEIKKASSLKYNDTGDISVIFKEPLTESSVDNFDKTLRAEIVYHRSQYGLLPISNEMANTDKINLKYADNYYTNHKQELVDGLYYVPKELVDKNVKEHTYIYDSKTEIAYKIENTKIAKVTVHSLEYLMNPDGDMQNVVKEEGTFASINSTPNNTYYTPNLKGFAVEKTYVVYYDKSAINLETSETEINTNTNDTNSNIKKILLKDYEANGKQRTITENGKEYVFYDYENKIWANVVTENNNQQSWWVWIPRYAYTINADNTIDIAFVDTNTPASPSFTVDGNELQGIWGSKYEPSGALNTATDNLAYYMPDMTGFDPETTYLEVYDEETKSFDEKKETKLAKVQSNLKNFSNNNLWYNYDKKIWANVKTTANGLEAWWVWIPRYAYLISGDQIYIKFVDLENNPLDGSDLGAYIIHPAFTIKDDEGNDKELKGIWASKYELTGVASVVE